MIEKRGLFFSIDAVVAIGVILVFIIAIYPIINEKPIRTEVHYDVLSTFSSLKAGETSNAYLQELISSGMLNNTNKSLLETMGELYVTNKTIAANLASSLIDTLDTTENVGIWYNGLLLAAKNRTPYENAEGIEATRQIISGLREGNGTTGFSARAYLSNSRRTDYYYFGGYIGDGNISIQLNYTGELDEAVMEITINNDFELYVNSNLQGSFSKSASVTTPSEYSIPLSDFHNGTNLIELRGNNLYISGGFIKISYNGGVQYVQPIRYNFPSVRGAVNIYDGFYIPGQLQSMNIRLNYQSPYNMFLAIGNKTIYTNSSASASNVTITDSQLSSLLNYNEISLANIPVRLGLENVTLNGTGITDFDVILITDVSGSMDWRMNSDSTGTARNCDNPLLTDPSTKRLSLAKCLDKDFVATIINASSSSRVALISFANDANGILNFTRDITLLNNTINAYSANGATCVSCALNRANIMLQQQSNSSRMKFVVLMTDGVTNRRSTPTCNDITGISSSQESTISVGSAGLSLNRSASAVWMNVQNITALGLRDIDLLNDTLGFAVGNSGTILRWNGTGWINQTSPVSSNIIYQVDIYNDTYALAVDNGGHVLRWNGASWSIAATISGAPTLNGINIFNSTRAVAVGYDSQTRAKIYRSTNGGASWTSEYTGSSPTSIEAVKTINSTLAYAVGYAGMLLKWNGASWSSQSSGTTQTLYAIDSINSTYIVATGGNYGRAIIIQSSGGSWSTQYDGSGDDSLYDLVLTPSESYAIGASGVIMEKGASWTRSFLFPEAYKGNRTSGVTCVSDSDSCTETNSFAALNANYSACRTRQETNAKIYSVGFGPIATCNLASQNLQSIASCGNGTFYASSNASALQQIYATIAQQILQLSYAEQTALISGNFSSSLYPDSYIEFNYTSPTPAYGLRITTESNFINSTTGTIDIINNLTVVDSRVVSYSGPRWTNLLKLNNNTIFNLTTHGTDYTRLGDPYMIQIPTSQLLSSNTIFLTTAVAPSNTSSGSASNKIITTIIKNASGYSPISSYVEGCNWTIEIEPNQTIYVNTPPEYSGINRCYYTQAQVAYDGNDAIQTAVFRLLQNLDLDSDSRIDVSLDAEDIDISLSQITGIPFTWWTEVQVRVWR